MSIASEITRLQGAKADLKTAIEAKGVTVPPSTKLDGYADLVDDISTGTTPMGTFPIAFNGIYNVSRYEKVDVGVMNSYTSADEGKVVDNGELVAQTSATYTANDTYDTTLINEVVVNVSGGGGSTLPQTGTITPASNTANMGTIDTGVDFTHFLIYTTSSVTGSSVKALRGIHCIFSGDGTPSSLFLVSTNNSGSSYSAYASLGANAPSKSGNNFSWTSMGTSGTAAGYLLSGKTYEWYAW